MRYTVAPCLAALAAWLSLGLPRALGQGPQLGPEESYAIRERVGALKGELENLQEDFVSELQSPRRDEYWRKADSVLRNLLDVLNLVKEPGAGRAELYQAYDGMEAKLHDFTADVANLARDNRVLQRGLRRVERADLNLEELLAPRDAADPRWRRAVTRQAETFLAQAREFQEAVSRGQVRIERRGERDLGELIEAARTLADRARRDGDRVEVRRDFQRMEEVWQRLVRELNERGARDDPAVRSYLDRLERTHDMMGQRLR